MDITGDEGLAEAIPAPGIIQTDNGPFQVTHGMAVLGVDGEHVGVLKEVRRRAILVDRPWHRDVYVPFDHIKEVKGEALVLTVPAAQVDEMNWPHPPLLDFSSNQERD